MSTILELHTWYIFREEITQCLGQHINILSTTLSSLLINLSSFVFLINQMYSPVTFSYIQFVLQCLRCRHLPSYLLFVPFLPSVVFHLVFMASILSVFSCAPSPFNQNANSPFKSPFPFSSSIYACMYTCIHKFVMLSMTEFT